MWIERWKGKSAWETAGSQGESHELSLLYIACVAEFWWPMIACKNMAFHPHLPRTIFSQSFLDAFLTLFLEAFHKAAQSQLIVHLILSFI